MKMISKKDYGKKTEIKVKVIHSFIVTIVIVVVLKRNCRRAAMLQHHLRLHHLHLLQGKKKLFFFNPSITNNIQNSLHLYLFFYLNIGN